MVSGIVFVAVIGTRLLPASGRTAGRTNGDRSRQPDLEDFYQLRERLFRINVPADSALVGKTLAESRLGAALGLNVVGIARSDQTLLAPESSERIVAGDDLIVEGRPDRIEELNHWGQLLGEGDAVGPEGLYAHGMQVAAIQLAGGSRYINQTLSRIGFRNHYGMTVLALLRDGQLIDGYLKTQPLRPDDLLVVQGPKDKIAAVLADPEFTAQRQLDQADLEAIYPPEQRLHQLRVQEASTLVGLSVRDSRLGDAVDIQIVYILRQDGRVDIPSSDTRFAVGDRLVVSGAADLFAIIHMQGLEGVFVHSQVQPADPQILEDDQVGLVEVMLSPHSTLSGKTLRQMHFREKYGLTVLAIWRRGRAFRSNLRDMALEFGDALLLFGRLKKTDGAGA